MLAIYSPLLCIFFGLNQGKKCHFCAPREFAFKLHGKCLHKTGQKFPRKVGKECSQINLALLQRREQRQRQRQPFILISTMTKLSSKHTHEPQLAYKFILFIIGGGFKNKTESRYFCMCRRRPKKEAAKGSDLYVNRG